MFPQEPQKQKDFIFFKNITLLVVFFLITPIVIATSFFSLFQLRSKDAPKTNKQAIANKIINPSKSGISVYASLPSVSSGISATIEAGDARVAVINEFLKKNDSELAPYSELIVVTADKYDLDYRLIVAIAQKESGLCNVIPPGGYNCWGWGIHSAGTLGFDSYEEGIETVSKGLKENYYDLGYETVDDIMSKYTPLSQGTWAEGVNFYMNQMQF